MYVTTVFFNGMCVNNSEKKGRGYGRCWRWFHPLYYYFFGIGEGIGKLLKLL
jgi:hypothetical protein